MLRIRILTAIVLIPLVVAGVLLLPSNVLALAFGVVVVLGAREMGRLGGLQGLLWQWLYASLVGVSMWLLFRWSEVVLAQRLEILAVLFWASASVALVARRHPVQRVVGPRPVILLLGAGQLLVAWLAVLDIHRGGTQGPALLLFVLVLIWAADAGAYFAGRALGRHKLSPQVSPGKTWEGVAGGLIAVVLCAGLFQATVGVDMPFSFLILLSLFTGVVSVGGDLWESLLKRQAGLKDSGTLLPGHGGVLDRIDSLIAAVPLFALGLRLLGGTS